MVIARSLSALAGCPSRTFLLGSIGSRPTSLYSKNIPSTKPPFSLRSTSRLANPTSSSSFRTDLSLSSSPRPIPLPLASSRLSSIIQLRRQLTTTSVSLSPSSSSSSRSTSAAAATTTTSSPSPQPPSPSPSPSPPQTQPSPPPPPPPLSSTSVSSETSIVQPSASDSTIKKGPLARIIPSSIGLNKETSSSIRKLLELARPERRTINIAIGLLFVSSCISMSVPLTIGKLIDFFSNPESTSFLGMSFPVAASVLTGFFIIGAATNAGRAFLMRLSGQRIIARVRNEAYKNILRQEVEYADRGTGDILSRLGSDTTIVGESVTSNLSDGLRAMISALVGVGAMVYISTKLTLVMLAVVPPVSLGAVFYGRYLRSLSKQTQEALGDMTKVAEEKLSAYRTVTAFNTQKTEADSFSKKVDGVLQLARKEAMASGIFFGGTGLTGNLTMLCLLGYGGHLVSLGEISVGSLTSLLIYTGYVGGSVSGLTGFFTGLMKGVGAGSRVFELLDRVPAIKTDVGSVLPSSRNGDIVFEAVDFAYPSRKNAPVLQKVDLRIEQGTSVAIVGPSGSGKSSIHALLLRYYDPESGVVTFDGEDIRNFTTTSWRNKLGIVPQDPPLFTGTIAENISYGTPEASEADILRAAKQANCDFIFGLPEGLSTQIGKASLSGGQKQRISIARALLRNPSVLLLDEATSALDSAAEHQVNQAISSILAKSSITVILVAHRLSSISQAERVIVLENGRVTEEGLYSDLSTRENSRFRDLMAAQLALEGRRPAVSSKASLESALTEAEAEKEGTEESTVSVEVPNGKPEQGRQTASL